MTLTQDDLETYGLACLHQHAAVMAASHRHNEVELNFVATGALTYRFGGTPTVVPAGKLALFWAAVPHQLVRYEPHTSMWWLTVPLARFLQWHLPEALTARVLSGTPVIAQDPALAAADAALFGHWEADLQAGSHERRTIVILEVEARLRRLALELPSGAQQPARQTEMRGAAGDAGRVELLARHIAEHYTEALTVPAIAAAAGLHPNYAMALFQRTFGLSMGAYLTQYRVADAQRLLATTDARIVDVALAVGFGSVSRFYAAFSRICGKAPRAYRTHVQSPSESP